MRSSSNFPLAGASASDQQPASNPDQQASLQQYAGFGARNEDKYCIRCGQEANIAHRRDFARCAQSCFLCKSGGHSGHVCPLMVLHVDLSWWAARGFTDEILGIRNGVPPQIPAPAVRGRGIDNLGNAMGRGREVPARKAGGRGDTRRQKTGRRPPWGNRIDRYRPWNRQPMPRRSPSPTYPLSQNDTRVIVSYAETDSDVNVDRTITVPKFGWTGEKYSGECRREPEEEMETN